MRKLILSALIIGLALALSGCQLITEFVIVNKSSDLIEIVYEVKKADYKDFTPFYITLEEFNNNEMRWRSYPKERQIIDKEKGIVEVKLAPNEVLRLESSDDVRIRNQPYEEFNTKSLKITGKNGSIYLEGNQVFEQFKTENKSWALISSPTYVIYYSEQ